MQKTWLALFAGVLCTAILTVAGAPVASAQVGDITFPTSASAEAQEHFLRGVAILHSFGFEDAMDAFREAQTAEPDFALSYWGEAMCFNYNPLSSPTRQDLASARDVLKRLAPTRRERLAKARTERERLYMEAVEALYGAGSKDERDLAYANVMRRLVESYPDDEEAKAFYALGLLGTVRRAGDNFQAQMQAAAVAQAIFRDNPRHPGAAHYIIHAFDDPLHASLALYAADRYAEIAPDVEHALHMPSHIFVQLGLWEKVAKSNDRAYRASVEWAERRGLSPTKRDFHALAWLQYASLQLGDYARAKATVDEIRPIAEREETTPPIRATYANMTARYIIETGELDAFEIPVDQLLVERHAGDVFLLLAASLQSLDAGDVKTAEKIEARLSELQHQDTAGLKSYLQGQVTLEDLKTSSAVAYREVAALVRLAQGKGDEAVRFMQEAMEKEKEMHPAYGPPEPMIPPQELYGVVLLELGRTQDAAAAFSRMLARMPNRTQSLLGAARAAAKLGDRETARRRYLELRDIWGGHQAPAAAEETKRFLSGTEAQE